MPTTNNPGDMPAKITRSQYRQVEQQARRVKTSIPISGDPRGQGPLGRPPVGIGLIPAVVISDIAQGSGTTPGPGTAQLYYLAADGDTTATADADNAAVTVLNWFTNTGSIVAGKHIQVYAWSGAYWYAGGC